MVMKNDELKQVMIDSFSKGEFLKLKKDEKIKRCENLTEMILGFIEDIASDSIKKKRDEMCITSFKAGVNHASNIAFEALNKTFKKKQQLDRYMDNFKKINKQNKVRVGIENG